ncbi:MAG: endolytic transglycosylase MltG [Hyphomicrobiaceae bacterium]
MRDKKPGPSPAGGPGTTGQPVGAPPVLSRTAAPTPRSPAELLVPTRPPASPRRVKAVREPRKLNGFFRLLNGALSFAFLLLLLGGILAVTLRIGFDQPGPLAHATVFAVPKGEGVYDIAGRLEKDGVVSDRRLFMAQYFAARMYGSLAGDRTGIKAGDYEIKKNASIRQVLDTFVDGRAILFKVTVPEGLTSQQIIERLKADTNLTGEVAQVPPEGSLLPDTYKVSRGMSRQELIDRMQSEHQKLMATLWEKRQKDLPVRTPEQAMVLASIVEKETGRADERDKVAAVFVNRLRAKMRLQSDPTIIYGLVAGQGTLGRGITRADIDSKTPYNTYQIDGLPPGPICNPGRASIEATLNPASTADLYFVADGTGGHVFTTNLKDHNAAVQNWRRVEREMKARQQQQPPAAGTVPPATPVTVVPVPVPTQTVPVPPAQPAAPEPAAPTKAASEPPPAKKATKKQPPQQ